MRKCICGHTSFHDIRVPHEKPVRRWVQYSGPAGFGSIPYGTFVSGLWGLFPTSMRICDVRTVCNSCKRKRLSLGKTGMSILGAYRSSTDVYIVGADFQGIAGCGIRFTGARTYFSSCEEVPVVPPVIAMVTTPLQTSATQPLSGYANGVVKAAIPVMQAGTYDVSFVDPGFSDTVALLTITVP